MWQWYAGKQRKLGLKTVQDDGLAGKGTQIMGCCGSKSNEITPVDTPKKRPLSLGFQVMYDVQGDEKRWFRLGSDVM